jgi:hypothetical protein
MKRLGRKLAYANVLAAIALLIALGVTTASAKPAKTYPTTSTLEVKKTTLAGKISSPKAACLKDRKVHGVWRAPGAHLVTEPATSSGSGKWVIQFEVAPGSKGDLSITIAPKSLGGGATCKGFEMDEVVAK